MCARALVHALNDAKNRAQQGCAMQFSGITLNGPFTSVENKITRVLSIFKKFDINFLENALEFNRGVI